MEVCIAAYTVQMNSLNNTKLEGNYLHDLWGSGLTRNHYSTPVTPPH